MQYSGELTSLLIFFFTHIAARSYNKYSIIRYYAIGMNSLRIRFIFFPAALFSYIKYISFNAIIFII